MTAIGFILMVLGFIFVKIFGDPWGKDAPYLIGGLLFIAGFIATTSGIAIWLWSAMP